MLQFPGTLLNCMIVTCSDELTINVIALCIECKNMIDFVGKTPFLDCWECCQTDL